MDSFQELCGRFQTPAIPDSKQISVDQDGGNQDLSRRNLARLLAVGGNESQGHQESCQSEIQAVFKGGCHGRESSEFPPGGRLPILVLTKNYLFTAMVLASTRIHLHVKFFILGHEPG
jgi:hypothetical protein